MEKAIDKALQALKDFDLFIEQHTMSNIDIGNDSYFQGNFKQASFNSNDNNSIDFYINPNKQLNFD